MGNDRRIGLAEPIAKKIFHYKLASFSSSPNLAKAVALAPIGPSTVQALGLHPPVATSSPIRARVFLIFAFARPPANSRANMVTGLSPRPAGAVP